MMFSGRFSLFFCALLLVAARARAQQVTLQIGQNFTGSTYGVNTQALPPDSNGSIGPHHFVEFINGEFAVYNKTNGHVMKRISDTTFWTQAIGNVPNSGLSDPRVIYDPLSQRWFATMVDLDATATDPTLENNDFLIAVSATSDPTGKWQGTWFPADPDDVAFADFPTLGVDSNAVYISGDFFQGETNPIGAGLLSIPKADLLLSQPSADNRTWFGVMDYSLRGQVFQPVMCFDGTSSGNVVATGDIGTDPIPYSNIVCFAVLNSATTNATLSAPTFLNVLPYQVPYNSDMGAPAFTVTQPDDTSALDGNDARFSARVYGVAGVLYAIHNTELNNHMAIRWYRINAATHALMETGTMADNNQDLFFPAIAANASGTVVIGYNACGLSNTVSCYAVAGRTVNGVTTFGSPVTLQTGATSYHGDDELVAQLLEEPPYSRWGDYNSLSADPADPTRFWSIIMFPSDAANNDVYSTQISELITTVPRPQLAISRTGTNLTVSWPSTAAGFTLQSSTNPAVSLAWTNVTQTPVTNGSQISVVLAASTRQQSFRLKQ